MSFLKYATLAVLLVSAAHAGDAPPLTDAIIHDYLIRHPEVLIEMTQILDDRQRVADAEQAKKGIAENQAALFRDPRDPVLGNPKGDVTIVIFQDKECPYCKAIAPDIAKLYASDKGVRVVYKEFPILGTGSTIAAHAALAAMKQGKFEDFNARLFADKTPEHQLTEAHILEIAKASGIDLARLKADMAAPEIDSLIADNKRLADKIGINGTPGILVGDHLAPGAVPYEDLVSMVADQRAAAKH